VGQPRLRESGPNTGHFLPLLYIAGLADAQPFDLLVEGHAAGSIFMAAYTVGLECDTSGVITDGPAAALPAGFPTDESNL
jgi:4,5-DOPA dioxygenase extradiol